MSELDVETMLEHAKLRDKFAKAAITGILAGRWGQMPHTSPEKAFADFAYRVADEMMKRRETHGTAQ